jgi:SAM-dependent methyltransferase
MENNFPSSEKTRHEIGVGRNTASPLNVQYRLECIAGLLQGRWLDAGCAEGTYTNALLTHGANEAFGVDLLRDRVAAAAERFPNIDFREAATETLPFPDSFFDGIWLNEVLEHVADERRSLAEFRRVLQPNGVLVILAPNRWFPFEGHSINIGSWVSHAPMPFVPWLPRSVTDRWTTARNYWPSEVRKLVREAGFDLAAPQFIMPVLEVFPWLPQSGVDFFQKHLEHLDDIPIVRRFGVSNLVIAHPCATP